MDGAYSTAFGQKIRLPYMGPQDPKDVTRDTARDLSALVGESRHRRHTLPTGSPTLSTPPYCTVWRLRTRRSRRRWLRRGGACG